MTRQDLLNDLAANLSQYQSLFDRLDEIADHIAAFNGTEIEETHQYFTKMFRGNCNMIKESMRRIGELETDNVVLHPFAGITLDPNDKRPSSDAFDEAIRRQVAEALGREVNMEAEFVMRLSLDASTNHPDDMIALVFDLRGRKINEWYVCFGDPNDAMLYKLATA